MREPDPSDTFIWANVVVILLVVGLAAALVSAAIRTGEVMP